VKQKNHFVLNYADVLAQQTIKTKVLLNCLMTLKEVKLLVTHKRLKNRMRQLKIILQREKRST